MIFLNEKRIYCSKSKSNNFDKNKLASLNDDDELADVCMDQRFGNKLHSTLPLREL